MCERGPESTRNADQQQSRSRKNTNNTTQPSPGNHSEGISAREYSKQMLPAWEQFTALPTAKRTGLSSPEVESADECRFGFVASVYIISHSGSICASAVSDLTETPAFPAEENSQDETEASAKTASDHKPEPQAGNTRRTIIEQAGEF